MSRAYNARSDLIEAVIELAALVLLVIFIKTLDLWPSFIGGFLLAAILAFGGHYIFKCLIRFVLHVFKQVQQ